jgi:hypothetical protein
MKLAHGVPVIFERVKVLYALRSHLEQLFHAQAV